MGFFILTRFVLVKYSRAFIERPSQGTSSLASRLTTVSLDYIYSYILILTSRQCNVSVTSQVLTLHMLTTMIPIVTHLVTVYLRTRNRSLDFHSLC